MDFLDIITMISFMMQLQNNAILRTQATNDDIINNLHTNVDRLEHKLDTLVEMLSKHS